MLYEPSNDAAMPMTDAQEEATFARVWDRVVPPSRRDTCLILPSAHSGQDNTSDPIPAEAPMPMLTEHVETRLPAPVPPQHVSSRAAPENDVPYLGASSAVYGAMLQEFIEHELVSWRTYLALSRRAPAGGNRILASIAADERRHAKRLSAAYFLISGVQYWPMERMGAAAHGAWPAALRRCFSGEQRAASRYHAAAAETSDPALYALYTELAIEESRHAQLLRELLERL